MTKSNTFNKFRAPIIGLCVLLCMTLWVSAAQAQQMRTNLAVAGAIPQDYTLTDSSLITALNNPNINDSDRAADSAVGVVDWVEVQIRLVSHPPGTPVPTAPTARPSDDANVYIKAAWLLSDGSVVDVDSDIAAINEGTADPDLTIPTDTDGLSFETGNQDLYVLISHRNHLPIMSASAVSADAESVYNYDFTTGVSQAVGGASALNVRDSVSTMIRGNSDGDANVFPADVSRIRSRSGFDSPYDNSDIDLNAVIGPSDESAAQANDGAGTQITY